MTPDWHVLMTRALACADDPRFGVSLIMRRVAYLKNGASKGALARNNASYRFRPALSRGNSFAVQSMIVCDELQGYWLIPTFSPCHTVLSNSPHLVVR